MRSALIITTFALAVLAAPIPEANPIYKNNGQGCVHRVAGRCIVHERDLESTVETNVEDSLEDNNLGGVIERSPGPYNRGKGKVNRDTGTDDSSFESAKHEARSPALHRNKNGRSPSLHRNKNGRSAQPPSTMSDFEDTESHEALKDLEDLLTRYTRGGGWKDIARSAEPESVRDDQSKRAPAAEPWTRGTRPPNVLPEAPKQDLQARGHVRGSNKRESDASHSSSVDLELHKNKKGSVFVRSAGDIEARSPEAEPSSRIQVKSGKPEGGACPV